MSLLITLVLRIALIASIAIHDGWVVAALFLLALVFSGRRYYSNPLIMVVRLLVELGTLIYGLIAVNAVFGPEWAAAALVIYVIGLLVH